MRTKKNTAVIADVVVHDTGEIRGQVIVKPNNQTGDKFVSITDEATRLLNDLPKSATIIYYALGREMTRKNRVNVNISKMAKDNNLSRPTVLRQLITLEERGFIKPNAPDEPSLQHYYFVNPYYVTKTALNNIDALRAQWGKGAMSKKAIAAQIEAIDKKERSLTIQYQREIAELHDKRQKLFEKYDAIENYEQEKSRPGAATSSDSQ